MQALPRPVVRPTAFARRVSFRPALAAALMLAAVLTPLWPATAGAVTYAYLPNMDAGTVSVVRSSDNAITATILVGLSPYGAAVSPDGKYVYVTNRDGGTLSIISTSTAQVTETLPVGKKPTGVAVSPDGLYVYVANHDDDTVSVIATDGDDNNEVTAILSVGDGPFGIAVDPGGDYVYVTNEYAGTVSVITTDQNPVTVTVGDGPLGIAADPDGEYVYVANSLDNTVSIISIEGDNTDTDDDEEADDDNQVVATVAVGSTPWGVAVCRNQASVFVTNQGSDTVSVIRQSDNAVLSTVPVGDAPSGVAVALNGNGVYVVNHTDNNVTVIDAASLARTTFSAGAGPVGLGMFMGGRPPSAPTGLTAEATSYNTIELNWSDNAYDETGFKIERRRTDNGEEDFVQVAAVGSNVTSYEDDDLAALRTYEYRIRAFNEAADSAYSATVGDTTGEDTGTANCFIGLAGNSASLSSFREGTRKIGSIVTGFFVRLWD